jgi:hypothetical protein
MLERTFSKFIEKNYPKVIETLKLGELEAERRHKDFEKAMIEFRNALENDLKPLIKELVKAEYDKISK